MEILIVGSTTYDGANLTSQASVCAIAKEWNRTDASYTTRISHSRALPQAV
jgi:hypothetical protein